MWIPYDSTLVLGNIIDESKLEALQAVSQLKQVVDTAQDSYNAQLRNKMACDMSIQQMEGICGTIEFLGVYRDSKQRAIPEEVCRHKMKAGVQQILDGVKQVVEQGGGIVGLQAYNEVWIQPDHSDNGYCRYGRQPVKNFYNVVYPGMTAGIKIPGFKGKIDVLGGGWQNAVYRVTVTGGKTGSKMMAKLQEAQDQSGQDVMQSLMNLIDARIEFEDKYTEMMETKEQTLIGAEPESPIMFSESEIQDLPLSSDSLNMDVQYFRKESGSQGAQSHVKQVSGYVAKAANGFGASVAAKAEHEAQEHMHRQTEGKKLVGTLVVNARATHKNAKLYDAKYDAKKLVRAWNAKVKDDPINLPGDLDDLYAAWSGADGSKPSPDDKKMAIITGQTFGSSFTGMVHFMKSSATSSYEKTRKSAQSVAAAATFSAFFGQITGAFGGSIDRSSASNVKELMSSNQINSHVTIMTMGLIPTIASQNVATALKKFSEFDGAAMNGKLCALASGKHSKATDMDGKAKDSIRAGQITSMERAKIDAVISGVTETDKANNSVLNMNSMMAALDDYVKNVRDAESGVPLNFFITSLRKNDVVGEWIKEFRPNMYNKAMSGEHEDNEDSDDEGNEGGNNGDDGDDK